MSAEQQTAVQSSERCGGTYYVYALPQRPAGLHVAENDTVDTLRRHSFINPWADVATTRVPGMTKVAPASIALVLQPGSDGPEVTIVGGPRNFWDSDDGISEPTIPLSELARLVAVDTPIAVSVPESYGDRALTFVSVSYRPRRPLASTRTLISIGMQPASLDLVQFIDPNAHNSTWRVEKGVMIEQAALRSAVRALVHAADAAEVIAVDYTRWRSR